jgi:hypothetical protein
MSALNLLVFREDRRYVSGKQLRTAVAAQLEQQLSGYSPDSSINALLLAGELECGIADAESSIARAAQSLTEQIADALMRGRFSLQPSALKTLVASAKFLPVPEQLTISTPEGFAYYALHPLAYADVLNRISFSSKNLVVAGIRSIGTTLSAVTAAAARARGMEAQRFTVRPQGHPYNRRTEFSSERLGIVENAIAAGNNFLIVDEGPGLSGSSFLSVAEALERAGVSADKIILISSHQPNADALCSQDAAERWKRYRCVPVNAEARKPAEAVKFIGGGEWRSRFFATADWPATWTSFERLKYLSEETKPRLHKFAGLGHYGENVFTRELKVAEAGFGPSPRKEIHGFVSYPLMNGRALSASDLSPAILVRLAEYCAFRLQSFPADLANLNSLQQMAEHNLQQFGVETPIEVRLEHPVIADGHMQPHEWLQTKGGQLLKTDSGSHGDDHFFPGPTDIAWDLAGAIVEWQMTAAQMHEFLELYHRASGDNAGTRIDDSIRAYAIFRAAYCQMAANAMHGSAEEIRLQKASAKFLDIVKRTKAASVAGL